jgi:hypothetical protein
MARVEEWFGEWLERHARRHPRDDWPPPGDDLYRGWIGNFVLHGVVEDVAEEASVRLMAAPPRWLGEHVQATLDAARAIFRERAERQAGHDPSSRESALLASRDCPDCGGGGLAVRWRHRSAGPGVLPAIVLYCTCPHGRWLERTHREHAPDVRRRLHDLADHPWLQLGPVAWQDGPDNRHRYQPASWDDAAGRPLPPPRTIRPGTAVRAASELC